MLFSTQQEAQAHAAQLGPAYDIIPCDDPDRGLGGLIACAKDDSQGDQTLQWPLFGKPLEPEEVRVTPEELLHFVRTNVDVRKYDRPQHLLLGAVLYQPDEGKALIRLISIRDYKTASDDVRQQIEKWRYNKERDEARACC